MTDEQKELLKNAGIAKEDYENCYISVDGKIFTPLKNKDEKIIKTGEQVYKEDYLNPPTLEPTADEIITKTIANLKIDNIQKDNMMTNTLKTIADLKVEVMSLKGGN